MPLARNSTGARRCRSTVAPCAGTSICSPDTRPRDAPARRQATDGVLGLLQDRGFCPSLSGTGSFGLVSQPAILDIEPAHRLVPSL